MISLFDRDNTNFSGNGNVVLMPTECSHRQVAAGKYDLTLVHPIDPGGKWTHIIPEAIIRAPVPEETIATAVSGMDVDVYKTNTNAPLRSGASEPTTINYTTWTSGSSYAVDAKVTDNGVNKNYQLTELLVGNEIYASPHSLTTKWREIARKTSGSPILVNLKSGTDLFFDEDAGSGWYKMITTYGLEGYIKSSQVTYDRHLTPAENQPRVITTQLFRIKSVAVDSRNKTITATAEHVSYDMSGVLIDEAQIHQKNPAETLAWIEQGMMMDYPGMIATNMTDDDDGTYTGEIKGKNVTYALLDPDKGVVSAFDAMYQRDNWDVFVMRKTETDRGFRLRYGKNMIGVSWNIKSDGLVTRVVPVAKDADGSDLYLDNDGEKWVDSLLIGNYPVIRMERIRVDGQVGKDDGTETATNWTVETLREHMEEKAEERFTVDKADQLVHDITISFEMLGNTEEYRALKGLEKVLLYDKVIAVNEQIQLGVTVEVSEIEYDCIREKVTAVKLTNVNAYNGRSVSGFNVYNNSITQDKLTDDVADGIGENANEYTDTKVSSLNSTIRTWVAANFEPKS